MKVLTIFLAVTIYVSAITAYAADSIDLAWDWSPGDSGYTSGPNGDIAYDIYMRTTDNSNYAYDYPVISGIDNCWWEIDHYVCETTLAYAFEPDERYHLVAVAYLAGAPSQRSLSSNEITYPVPKNASGGGGGGGGFFVSSAWGNR